MTICEDVPDITCDNCDAVYVVIGGSPLIRDGVEYCPFCGDEREPFEDSE